MHKIALTVLIVALGLPAAAGAASPCSEAACHARIHLDGTARWTSPQRLSGQLEQLSLRAGGRLLDYEPVGGCRADFYGRGTVVRLSVCGSGRVRLRIRAVRVVDRPVTLRLSYRVAA